MPEPRTQSENRKNLKKLRSKKNTGRFTAGSNYVKGLEKIQRKKIKID